MRKNFLYLFYAATSALILVTLNMELGVLLKASSIQQPQYVFTHKVDGAGDREKKELEMLRQWAEDFDPSSIKQ